MLFAPGSVTAAVENIDEGIYNEHSAETYLRSTRP
jgi:hypothetical protein